MNKATPSPSGQFIACPSCGHSNPAWYAACEKCGKQLSLKSTTSQVSAPRQAVATRPGCLTAYAVFLGISAALLTLAGVLFILGLLTDRRYSMNAPLVGGIILTFSFAAFYFLLAQGLINQKNWARIAAILIEIISIPGGLVGILAGLLQFSPTNDPSLLICGSIIRMGVSGYLIYWLSVNRRYFHR
ncbi:MAG TPA: hypothetical protein VFQ13_22680 [Anaerolineales bacterium]|nr:hypothetical protein [Anaerolineales bacterium]